MKNTIRFTALLVLALCMALSASAVFAQTATTGSIEGTVSDVNGAAVPGATVSVKSPNLIVAQTATTDDAGFYRILNLPPGKYTLTIEAIKGFGKSEHTDVEVNLGRTSNVTVRLEPEKVGVEVNVTASAGAAIDVAGNTTGSNVSTDQFSNFPTSRTVQGLFTIAPTVTRSGLRDSAGRDRDPSVAGSSGPENNYILDGVNTTDPAFGGSGANLPFEFVQEVEIKTGAYGAEYGKATGGIFNVITKSGGNEVRGDVYGYFVPDGLVRDTKNFAFTGSANNGYSEVDAGGDIGGPIKKDKLWFFGAFNPQFRKNFYLTQTLKVPVENKVTTPFYAGKLTWALNQSNIFTFSTFGDFTKVDGFLAVGALNNVSGFGSDLPGSFNGVQETGGHNYAFRLNSNISPTWIGEFMVGLHYQRNNTIPEAGTATPLVTDAFSVVRGGAVQPLTQSGLVFTPPATGVADPSGTVRFGQAANTLGNIDFVLAPGGSLQRNFVRQGWGLFSDQARNRYEASARLQNIYKGHTFKYGFEWYRNIYNINTLSTGPSQTFGNPLNLNLIGGAGNNQLNGFRVTNNFYVCTTRGTQVVCPVGSSTRSQFPVFAAQQLIGAGRLPGFTSAVGGAITQAEFFNNPLLIRSSTRVRDFELVANTYTNVESAYIQDDYKISPTVTVNLGLRWDFQQAYGNNSVTYLKLNNFLANTQPRVGVVWDFTGKGKGKLFANYGRFIETPIPLDVNVRAGSNDTQTDKNFNSNLANGAAGSVLVPGISGNWANGAVNLGAEATPIDPGLRPQSIEEFTGGFEYEIAPNFVFGTRGVYRNYVNVIEDGSFDDGNSYFLFNPGRRGTGNTTEDLACAGDPANDIPAQCFGRARRYYRAIEFSATKRFTNNYQFIASYVYSSLIGNYEGLFRNDNGQSDPNITSLFDLVSLLGNTYGRLPNDRPHQFKFNGSYQTPWRLMLSGNFYAQSGVPFNQLVPHPVYGNNEGFGVPRGTAIIPAVPADPTNPNTVDSVGSSRSPFTWNLDLGAYYPIKIGENRELRFTADWFNVFNQQRAVTLDNTFQINSGASGVPPVPNPFWGAGVIFQYPSALRLGAKFQF